MSPGNTNWSASFKGGLKQPVTDCATGSTDLSQIGQPGHEWLCSKPGNSIHGLSPDPAVVPIVDAGFKQGPTEHNHVAGWAVVTTVGADYANPNCSVANGQKTCGLVLAICQAGSSSTNCIFPPNQDIIDSGFRK